MDKKKTAVLTLSVIAILIAIGVYIFFRPGYELSDTGLEKAAGESLDLEKELAFIKNAYPEDIKVFVSYTGPGEGAKTEKTEGSAADGEIKLRPGRYEIEYLYKPLIYPSISRSLSVVVKDVEAPAISVPGELTITDYDIFSQLYPYDQIAEVSDDVTDPQDIVFGCLNEDFDPKKPQPAGDKVLEFFADDEAGNRSTAKLHLHVVPFDTQAPVIKGAADVKITEGDKLDYLKGVTAEDDIDGEVEVTVDSTGVDLNKPGVYTVKYTAADAYGNTAEVTTKISVEKKPEPIKEEPAPGDSDGKKPGSGDNGGKKPESGDNGGKKPESGSNVKYSPSGNPDVSWDAAGIKNQPYLVAVNRALCTATVYKKDDNGNYTVPCKAMICSVGKDNTNNQTPLGRFKTGDRYEWCQMLGDHVHYGRYAIRLDTSAAKYPSGKTIKGIMFHTNCYLKKGDLSTLEYDEYNKLGQPASLGCIRLTVKDCYWLYKNCPRGFTTIVYDDSTSPGPLGKPSFTKIDPSDEAKRGWEPTDPNEKNPWKK